MNLTFIGIFLEKILLHSSEFYKQYTKLVIQKTKD